MTLDTGKREALRTIILVTLNEAAGTHGLGVDGVLGIRKAVTMENPFWKTVDSETMEREVAYLVDKGLAEVVPKALSPENRHYRINAAGRDFLAEIGLG